MEARSLWMQTAGGGASALLSGTSSVDLQISQPAPEFTRSLTRGKNTYLQTTVNIQMFERSNKSQLVFVYWTFMYKHRVQLQRVCDLSPFTECTILPRRARRRFGLKLAKVSDQNSSVTHDLCLWHYGNNTKYTYICVLLCVCVYIHTHTSLSTLCAQLLGRLYFWGLSLCLKNYSALGRSKITINPKPEYLGE